MDVWDYIQAIAVIGIVIYAAFYVTRLVAKTGGGTFRKSANMQLIESLPLARDKSVAIVKIGAYAYVLGISPHHVEKLDKLALSELDLSKEEPVSAQFTASFKKELSSRLERLRK